MTVSMPISLQSPVYGLQTLNTKQVSEPETRNPKPETRNPELFNRYRFNLNQSTHWQRFYGKC